MISWWQINKTGGSRHLGICLQSSDVRDAHLLGSDALICTDVTRIHVGSVCFSLSVTEQCFSLTTSPSSLRPPPRPWAPAPTDPIRLFSIKKISINLLPSDFFQAIKENTISSFHFSSCERAPDSIGRVSQSPSIRSAEGGER